MYDLSLNVTNSTTLFPEYAGYIAATVSCIFFGSNLLPVKHYELDDGVLFQWITGSGVWFVGLIVHIARGFPRVYALPMLGGAMWATGNLFVVAIIKTIGLSLGILIWSSFNMICGWASGRFGWFGLVPQVPVHPTLNYIGVAFAAASAPCYFFIATLNDNLNVMVDVDNPPDDANDDRDRERLIPGLDEPDPAADIQDDQSVNTSERSVGFWDRFSSIQRKLIGCSFATFAGIVYGFNFVPVTYVTDHYKGASKVGLDHVFAHCSGIYITSTFYFIVYCLVLRNKPRGISFEAFLPGLVSGAMWSVANAGWMLANTTISEALSFPMITTGPSVIACLWGIFLYREIRGLRNFLLVGAAFALTITGSLLCGFSRPGHHVTSKLTL